MDAELSIVRPGSCDDEEVRIIIRLAMGKTVTAIVTPENLGLALTGKSDVPATIRLRNVGLELK
ncbi:hypothetical protein [Tatumella ptyseos]|uniref:hypothetical protein n=1 Tax=Tatumella ptyseos TaxID=82987 RepID=UPI0023F52E16|nr:hypothetical protein [Tatumella ptyseos]